MPQAFETNAPLFVFIDPFGATGAPFVEVARLLASERSEILINLDADGIDRIAAAEGAASSEAVLAKVFGVTGWQAHLDRSRPASERCRQVLQLYKSQLYQHARYVFSFEMRGKESNLNYYLVFASNHPLGLTKMKEVLRTIDQTGDYAFCDADVDQTRLFRFDHAEDWIPKMFDVCKGRRVEWAELERYVLNETPFIKVSALLQPMEKENYIAQVEAVNGVRRSRGQFTAKSVAAVRFVDDRAPTSLWDT